MGKHKSKIIAGQATKVKSLYDWSDFCRHEFQPVVIADKYRVFLSSYTSNRFMQNQRPGCVNPDLFVALDHAWETFGGGVWTNTRLDISKYSFFIPMLSIHWQDGDRLPTAQLSKIVPMLIDKIKAGQTIEIGCIGGHGRSGTLLALILGSMEGLSAHDAIVQTRKRYCSYAIESEAQVRAIYNMLGGADAQCAIDQSGIPDEWYGYWKEVMSQGTYNSGIEDDWGGGAILPKTIVNLIEKKEEAVAKAEIKAEVIEVPPVQG